LAVVAACTSSGGAETLIGAPCTTADECDPAGVCVTDGPDGMCTQTCMAAGYPGQCPLGSYCTAQGGRLLCFPACKEQDECREGYTCSNLSSGPGMVCVP
jgi:hypothetical protein